MTLIKWRPYNDLMEMYNKLTRMFEEDFTGSDLDEKLIPNSWRPVTDIYETKEGYVFKMELPGIPKEEIKIDMKDNILEITGTREESREVKKEEYHRMERSCGSFYRSFKLPDDSDVEKIDAQMREGILEIRIPKHEKAKVKSIPIKIK